MDYDNQGRVVSTKAVFAIRSREDYEPIAVKLENFKDQAGVTAASHISTQRIKMTSDSGASVAFPQHSVTVDSLLPGSISYETKYNFGP